LAYLKNAKK